MGKVVCGGFHIFKKVYKRETYNEKNVSDILTNDLSDVEPGFY